MTGSTSPTPGGCPRGRGREARCYYLKICTSENVTQSGKPRRTTTRTRIAMSSNTTLGVVTRSRKRKRECRDTNAGEAIPGLLNDIVVTHVLRSENFDDPARMFKRRAAPATGRSPVVSRTPLSGSGKRRAPRGAAVVACERLACGTQTRARLRRWAGISRCCSGHARTAARGTWTRARTRRRAGISRRCSGPVRTVANGTR